jgi:hypothetical protein
MANSEHAGMIAVDRTGNENVTKPATTAASSPGRTQRAPRQNISPRDVSSPLKFLVIADEIFPNKQTKQLHICSHLHIHSKLQTQT